MFDAQKILGALISDGVENGGFHSSKRRMHNDSQGLLSDLPGGSAGKMLIGAAGVAAAGGRDVRCPALWSIELRRAHLS